MEIEGDLLTINTDYIVHQTNCLTVNSHGLAASIAKKWPKYDLYATRKAVGQRNLAIQEDRGIPGSIEIFDDFVVCFLSQWRPGKMGTPYFHKYPEYEKMPETKESRLYWFKTCLKMLSKYIDNTRDITVAFPYRIGCGLAGGHWVDYKQAIQDWGENNPNVKVLIVKLINKI